MSALDELFDLIDEDICLHYTTRDARAELAAMRARVEQAERERDEARSQLREIDELIDPLDGQTLLEAVSYLIHDDGEPLTPRRCVTCSQEAAARLVSDYAIDMLSTDGDELDAVIERDDQIAEAIAALPLTSCDGCNPLKPEATQ